MNMKKINYIEFAAKDISQAKNFFSSVFGWQFKDYGPDYIAFSNQGVDGGFFKSDQNSSASNGAALMVFYSQDITATQAKIESAGGTILKPVFSFPGWRRFHFADPNENEYAVLTDVQE